MKSVEYYLWLAVFIIPLVIGFIFLFFPQKIVHIRARMQYYIFKSVGMDDDKIDKSPFYSIIHGEPYSKVLKSQIDNPREFRSLIIWVRILGFGMFSFGIFGFASIIFFWR